MSKPRKRCRKSQSEKLAECLTARAYMKGRGVSGIIHLLIDQQTLLDLIRRFYPEDTDERR